jgi:TPR repeat protein
VKKSCRCCKCVFTAFVLPLVVGALLCAPENVQAQASTSQPQQSPYSPAAIAALQRQAHAGDANAQFRLGISYEHGIGVSQDLAQAFSWYQKSAAQGSAPGEFYLGMMYLNGIGVPKDYPSAILLFKQAAAQGDADAENNLGAMYQYGLGVPQDNAQALAWYKEAAEQGNPRRE